MIEILDKSKCCGCTACYNVCPQHCIEMRRDEEGFLYPFVEYEKCINCGLCEKVCPFEEQSNRASVKEIYIVHHKNWLKRSKCSSGGAFTSMAEEFVEHGGVVYGAAYSKDLQVQHVRIDNTEQVLLLSGSKYVQSNLASTFDMVKQDLHSGKKVLFSGTPCQVEGLKRFLGGKDGGLTTVDFACHGVPSPLVWENYLEYIHKKRKSKVINANFRSKKYGYHNPTMELMLEKGQRTYGSAHVDVMLKAFFSEICSRPSCYNCAVKTTERVADITVFDSWHSKEVAGLSKDDNKGWTVVAIHSELGIELLEKISERANIVKVGDSPLLEKDGVMLTRNAVEHPKRAEFFCLMNQYGIERAIQETIPITTKDWLREYVKNFLCKTQIMTIIRQLKGK